MSGQRIAVLGAGPTGLEAACALSDAGYDVTVLERGRVGEGVRRWGHVTLFSPWALNQSARGRAARGAQGLSPLDEAHCPSGAEYVEEYLTPLAQQVRARAALREQTAVVSISRDGALKGQHIGGEARTVSPFRILCDTVDGESVHFADMVVDATGTYGNPTAIGPGGAPAVGERSTAGRVARIIPDVLGEHRARYAGRHSVVVGGGYSAATVLRDLVALRGEAPATRVTWVLQSDATPYDRVPDDPLPSRDALCAFANALADAPLAAEQGVTLVRGGLVALAEVSDGLIARVRTLSGELLSLDADEVIALTGYKPDVGLYSELQVHTCYGTDGPMKLAAVLMASDGAGSADCLEQSSAGPDALRTPEPGFFVLGAKSYGRRSSYLLKLGIEQVDELLELLAQR